MVEELCNVGTHQIARESENVFVYHFRNGAVSPEQLVVMENFERTTRQPGGTYHFVIFEDDVTISPGAITHGTRMLRGLQPNAAAVIVRSYYLRTALEFMHRTLRLIGSGSDMRFFEDEQIGREWLMQRRRELTKQS